MNVQLCCTAGFAADTTERNITTQTRNQIRIHGLQRKFDSVVGTAVDVTYTDEMSYSKFDIDSTVVRTDFLNILTKSFHGTTIIHYVFNTSRQS